MGTYEERWAAAAESFRNFVPEAEPERAARSFERRLGALGAFAFETVGDMWSRPVLPRHERSLLVIASLAAQARDDELVGHTQIGLRHGLRREQIEEILLHVAATAGFPAAMAASRSVDEGLRQAAGAERLSPRDGVDHLDDDERDRRAAETLASMLGREPAVPADELADWRERLGDVGTYAYRWDIGQIWSRPHLTLRERSIVTLAIVLWLGDQRAVGEHVHIARHSGLSVDEIEELITHAALYSGGVRAATAMLTAREAFAGQG